MAGAWRLVLRRPNSVDAVRSGVPAGKLVEVASSPNRFRGAPDQAGKCAARLANPHNLGADVPRGIRRLERVFDVIGRHAPHGTICVSMRDLVSQQSVGDLG